MITQTAAPADGALFGTLENVAAAVSELTETVFGGGLSGEGRLRALDEMQRTINRLQAAIIEDVRQIDEAQDWRRHGARSLCDFVKHRLRLEATGWKYATLARNLNRVPRLAGAFTEGTGNIEQCYDSWTRLKELPQSVPDGADYDDVALADVWAAADECLSQKVDELNGSQLKACAEHILAGVDAENHQRSKDNQQKGHGLSVSKLNDETVIAGTSSAVEGEILDRALRNTDAWAKKGTDDTRTARRRRLDALMEMARHFLDCGQTPQRRSARYHLVVHTELTGLVRALLHAITRDDSRHDSRTAEGSHASNDGADGSGQQSIPGTGRLLPSKEKADPLDVLATLLASVPATATPVSGSTATRCTGGGVLLQPVASGTRDPDPLAQNGCRPDTAGAVLLSPADTTRAGCRRSASEAYRPASISLPRHNADDRAWRARGRENTAGREVAQQIIGANPLVGALLRTNPLAPAARLESSSILGYRELIDVLTDANGADVTRTITGPPGSVPRTWPGPGWPGPADSDSGAQDSRNDTGRMGVLLRTMLALLPPPLGAPSELLDVGRTERFHTRAMRIGLYVRDGARCVVPGCTMPAQYLQIHHVLRWQNRGRTNTGDAAPCCSTHNNAVEAGAVLYRDQRGRWVFHPAPYDEQPVAHAA